MRRSRIWATVAVVALVGGVGSLWALTQADDEPSAPDAGPQATAEVTRGTIAATRTWTGSLGHGEPFTVPSATEGVVTRIVDQGAEVGRESVLLRVDEQPVVALLGAVPMYRDLGTGSVGADVAQLETELVALGYDGFTADRTYTSATADVVASWQSDLGVAVTGTVPRSSVVFLPEAGRVDSRRVEVGDVVAPGAPVLDVTGSAQAVTLTAEVADRELLAVGTTATVGLAGGAEVPGSVTSVQVVPGSSGGAASGGAASGGAEPTGAEGQTLEVEVTLGEPAAPELLGSQVDVEVPVDERSDVLLVPVNALLALAEGGYGLEVLADGSTTLVAVEAGLFADGLVEVSGDGLAEGMTVGTAGR